MRAQVSSRHPVITPHPSPAVTPSPQGVKASAAAGKLPGKPQKFTVSPEAPPLGELSPKVTERARMLPAVPRFRRKRRCKCRCPLRPLPVKTGQRNARRRSAVPNLKIIFPLKMRKANAARIPNRPALPLPRSGAAGKVSACRKRAWTLRWARGGEGCSDSPSLPLDSTHPATGQGLLALDKPKEEVEPEKI